MPTRFRELFNIYLYIVLANRPSDDVKRVAAEDYSSAEVATVADLDDRLSLSAASVGDVCSAKQFTCNDRSCIDQEQLCDLHQDCPDNSDEDNCSGGKQVFFSP